MFIGNFEFQTIFFLFTSFMVINTNGFQVSSDTVVITASSAPNHSRQQREISFKNIRNHEDCGKVKVQPQSDNKFTSFLMDFVAGNILGKKVALKGAYPWTAALILKKRGQLFYCGGSLVDHWHILTSASCVARMDSNDLAKMKVLLGTHDIYAPFESSRIVAQVSQAVFHKGFDSAGMENNIALLKLRKRISYTNYIQPICLSNGTDIYDHSNALATMTGWGQLLFDPLQYLNKLDVRIWDNKRCVKKYNDGKAGYFPQIRDDDLCAGSPVPPNKSLCQGNNGSPLVIKRHQRFELIGITSWGGANLYPCVFVKVNKYLPWIMRNIEKF